MTMSKLIQLKLSAEKEKRYNEIVLLLGLEHTFGSYQHAICFCIDYTLWALKKDAEVLPGLDMEKLAIWTATMTKLHKAQLKETQHQEIDAKP